MEKPLYKCTIFPFFFQSGQSTEMEHPWLFYAIATTQGLFCMYSYIFTLNSYISVLYEVATNLPVAQRDGVLQNDPSDARRAWRDSESSLLVCIILGIVC